MSAKSHYDFLLAEYYSWMCGDFDAQAREFIDQAQKND